jgi:predicted nuclease of restriction endonuclease-like (RecB) superfamily
LGKLIVDNQEKYGWGEEIVQQLAKDFKTEFEGERGFSAQNLWYMRNFYLTYKDKSKLHTLGGEISWSHNKVILDKCTTDQEREFYLKMAKNNVWSKRRLADELNNKTFERWLTNQTNFDLTISADRRAKATLAVKDDYNFEFLGMEGTPSEREIEDALIANITKLLAEMGGYFTFAGRLVAIKVSDDEYFIDLLFYHRQLKCLVAVDIKTGDFKPAYAGQMQFYLSALDEQARVEGENPSIGIIICQGKDRTVVEYTLKAVNQPIGVSTYHTYERNQLPEAIAKYLPTQDEIEQRLTKLPDQKREPNS